MNRNIHLRRLRKLSDAIGIKNGGTVNLSEVLKDEGLDEQGLINEADYLEDEGWIELLFAGPSIACLTHAGIKAAEGLCYSNCFSSYNRPSR